MVLDDALVAAGDEDEMLDARLARLVDDVLQDGTVDDRQHLLGNGFGRRQKARAEAGDGENGFADGFFHQGSVLACAKSALDRSAENLLSLNRSGPGLSCDKSAEFQAPRTDDAEG